MDEQTRKLRKLQPDNLIARLEKLPLAEKISTLAALKQSIEQDKKSLEEQLALINS